MNIRSTFRVLAVATALAGSAAAQAAPTLYGTLGTGGTTSTLVTIDTTTGAVTTIGSVGFAINGLAWDASTGTLYGSARGDVGLVTINTSTGAGTLVGAFNSASSGCSTQNVLLAANAAGSLYGWCDPSNDDLMSINKTTGAATIVGEAGLGTASHGLAFDAFGTLYMHNYDGSIYSMDVTTGAATYVGSSGVNAHHGDFNDDNNYYYGLNSSTGQIRVLNFAAGGATIATINTGVTSLHTLAFASAGAAVPSPAPVALLGAALAVLALQRRRAR